MKSIRILCYCITVLVFSPPVMAVHAEAARDITYFEQLQMYQQKMQGFQSLRSEVGGASQNFQRFLEAELQQEGTGGSDENKVAAKSEGVAERAMDNSEAAENMTFSSSVSDVDSDVSTGLQQNALDALSVYIKAAREQIALAELQLKIVQSGSLSFGLGVSFETLQLLRTRTDILAGALQELKTNFSSDRVMAVAEQIKSIWPQIRMTLARTSALFSADYAERLLAASEEKKDFIAERVAAAQTNGVRVTTARDLLQNLERLLFQAQSDFDTAVEIFTAIPDEDGDASAHLAAGHAQLRLVQASLEQFQSDYRRIRIFLLSFQENTNGQ